MSSQAMPPDNGQAWAKKLKKVEVSGGPLKGARYGDIPDSDIAKSAKSYRGDARFKQYCRLYMSAKLLDNKVETSETSESAVPSKWRMAWDRISPWVKRLHSGLGRGHFLVFSVVLIFLISRPTFSVLCGKLSVLLIKSIIKRTVSLITMIMDAILEEAVNQVDTAMLPVVPETVHSGAGKELIDRSSTSTQLLLHLFSLIIGSLLGRHFGYAPLTARNQAG